MKFESGKIEVTGLRRVIFGERPGRQHIYERKEAISPNSAPSDKWFPVDHVGQITDVDPNLGCGETAEHLTEYEMTRRIKGASRNKRSRVVINGDTVNVMKPKPVERLIPREPCDICGGSGAEYHVDGPVRMLCPRCKTIIRKYFDKKRLMDELFWLMRSGSIR
jgi:hypothetical protein